MNGIFCKSEVCLEKKLLIFFVKPQKKFTSQKKKRAKCDSAITIAHKNAMVHYFT